MKCVIEPYNLIIECTQFCKEIIKLKVNLVRLWTEHKYTKSSVLIYNSNKLLDIHMQLKLLGKV